MTVTDNNLLRFRKKVYCHEATGTNQPGNKHMALASSEKMRGLVYPWGAQAAAEPGVPYRVAEGVWWLRFPMPMSLDHINLWLLEDGDGWTIVDTCLDLPASRELWESLFGGFMQGRPVKRVICTHMHPDHVGLAGWLTRHFDCELWMARDEFLMCHTLVEDTGRHVVHELERYLNTLGTIAAISPLLGLLGTVTGMIRTFSALTANTAGDPSALAGGISEALITTAAGLMVAIPALIGYRYLRGRVDALVVQMEKDAIGLVAALQRKQYMEGIGQSR